MIFNLTIIKVDSDYCDYLRKFDSKVAYNKFDKELRPFIGVLFKVNNCEYFAPLSSPKPKHLNMKNSLDFFKINKGEFGAVNFNNMIPVTKENYTLVDLDRETSNVSEMKYQSMLKEQLRWLNSNYEQVKNKSHKLYTLFTEKKLPKNIMDRCCDFKLLESKCEIYNSKVKA